MLISLQVLPKPTVSFRVDISDQFPGTILKVFLINVQLIYIALGKLLSKPTIHLYAKVKECLQVF